MPLLRTLRKSSIFGLLSLGVALAPYPRGLFFEREWRFVHLATAILICLALILRHSKDCRTLKVTALSRLDLLGLGLAGAYALAVAGAVDKAAAIAEVLKVLNLYVVYRLMRTETCSAHRVRLFLVLLFSAGLGVALVGIAGALDVFSISGGYLNGRIYSTFQYPNTLAIYLGFIVFVGLHLWSGTTGRWRRTFLPALYAIIVCLLATGSRGGIIIFGAGCVLLALLLPARLRSDYCAKLALSLGLGFSGTLVFQRFISENNTLAAGLAFLLGAMVSWALNDENILGGVKSHRKHYRLVAGVLALSVGLAAVPVWVGQDSFLARLKSSGWQTSELQTRFTYYRDAAKLVQERPWFGFGGGGWALHPRYQDVSYSVSDPHSQLAKVWVESGSVGVIIYATWWISLARLAWRKRRQGQTTAAVLLAGLLMIGLHSLIDFDLSFGAMGLLVWAAAGIIAADRRLN